MTTYATANRSAESLLGARTPSQSSDRATTTKSSSPRRILSYLKSTFRGDETTTDPSFIHATPTTSTATFTATASDPTFAMAAADREAHPERYVESETDPSFVRAGRTALRVVESKSDPTFAMQREHVQAHPNRVVESRTDPSFTMLDGGRRFNC